MFDEELLRRLVSDRRRRLSGIGGRPYTMDNEDHGAQFRSSEAFTGARGKGSEASKHHELFGLSSKRNIDLHSLFRSKNLIFIKIFLQKVINAYSKKFFQIRTNFCEHASLNEFYVSNDQIPLFLG